MKTRRCACGCEKPLNVMQRTFASLACRARGSAEVRAQQRASLQARWAARRAERVAEMRQRAAVARVKRWASDARVPALWAHLERYGRVRGDVQRAHAILARAMRAEYLRGYSQGHKTRQAAAA